MNKLSLCRLIFAAVWAVCLPDIALAQGATNVITLTPDKTQTSILVGDYYSQVLVNIESFTMPSDDNGQKQLGKAILSAFGLGDKTRSLTISAVLSRSGTRLPEIPLITYTFDGKKRLTNYQVVNSYLSPRWQLDTSNPISFSLVYKYSEQATYNPTEITDNVKRLIPSDAIVSTLGTPFLQGIAGLTASIFQSASTRTVNVSNQDDLLPFSGPVGARALAFAIALPNGQKLGTIKASLVVSPSLIRPVTFAVKARPDDLKRIPGENVSAIQVDVGGVKKNLLQDIEGLPSFIAMAKAPAPVTVRDYCGKAGDALGAYGLTTMDRLTLVYRSLLDAGFDPAKYHATANSWRSDCFLGEDKTALTYTAGISFDPAAAPPPAVVVTEDKWKEPLKDAAGCWITNKSGEWCTKNAPTARTTLDKAFADQVRIGVIDLPGVDLTGMPIGRVWDKASLLTALNGKADFFRCYNLGFILIKNEIPYNMGVELTGGLISSVQILSAAVEAKNCH